MAYQEHITGSARRVVSCAVVTLSDTRNESTDRSGALIRQMLAEAGHRVIEYTIIKDEPTELASLLTLLSSRPDLEAIFTNGGTGISKRDQTIDVLEKRLDARLPGFGELFRMLSYEQIGAGAMLSRATAGVLGGKIVFAMPGSTKAVELAMARLILPELRHLVSELAK